MTKTFGLPQRHDGANAAGRMTFLFATDRLLERVVVYRGKGGNVCVRPYSGAPLHRVVGVYTRQTTLEQLIEDMRET